MLLSREHEMVCTAHQEATETCVNITSAALSRFDNIFNEVIREVNSTQHCPTRQFKILKDKTLLYYVTTICVVTGFCNQGIWFPNISLAEV